MAKKESTPPPLLLCPPSGGLTLTPAQGSSLLMPVPQTEASLIASDEFEKIAAEADSFVGQTPPKEPSPLSYFQPGAHVADHDPFSNVRQPMPGSTAPPMPYSSPAPPTSSIAASQSFSAHGPPVGLPPMSQSFTAAPASMTPPPRGSSSANINLHRMQGTPRYAPPPMGTYSPAQGPPVGGPGMDVPTSLPPGSGGFPPPPVSGFTPGPPGSVGISSTPGGMPTTEVSLGSPQGLPVQGFYVPVTYHWFHSANVELRQVWKPLSVMDSHRLEDAFKSGAQDNLIVSVQGGRYDVDIIERSRTSVYWEEAPSNVRRCSWFYKEDGESKFLPYDETFAEKLEEEYKNAITNNVWHKRLEFGGNETIVMHNPGVIVHYSGSSQPDEWGTVQGDQRPRVVKRGTDEFENLEEGEPAVVDHLVFVVHGIGPTCDLRFRNIIECVDDMRDISLQMAQSHFKQYQDEGRIGRVEFLPVRWHDALHADATGVDRKLKAITLQSISKLRNFTNDVLLDILFYGSPAYCQKITDVVADEMNRLHQLFLNRNPSFKGGVSVAGHSLGALILFDLLAHQGNQNPVPVANPVAPQPTLDISQQEQNGNQSEVIQEESDSKEDNIETLEQLLDNLSLSDYLENFQQEKIDLDTLSMCEDSDIKEMGIPMGPRKKLQSFIKTHNTRKEKKKEAEERRHREELDRKMKVDEERKAADSAQQAAQSAATNDPLLRQASCNSINFVKGLSGTGLPLVSYPKLNFLPNNFFALGSPVAMFLTTRGVEYLGEEFALPTCVGFFNVFHPFDPVAYRMEPLLTQLVPPKPFLMPHHKGRKRLHLELKESLTRMGADIKARVIDSVKRTWKTINDFALAHRTSPQQVMEQEVDTVISEMAQEEEDRLETGSIASSVQEEDILLGQLNQGRRVDYVLQERPIESFNDYLFALGSHYSYWESEDTILMMLKETYALMGLAPLRPGQDGGSPFKPRLAPPPMASPPGSLLASPSHGPPPSGLMTSPPGAVPPPMTHMSYGPGGQVAPPPMGGPVGMPPTSSSWPAAEPISQASSAPLGPPPMSGFVRK